MFLVAVVPKLGGDPAFAPRMTVFLQNLAPENAHGFRRGFLEAAVLPNPEFVAARVLAGEAVAGLGLLTGAATRLSGAVAALLTLNYMLAEGAWVWTPSSNDAAFLVIALVVTAAAAGRRLGVDRMLAERYPRIPLW